MRAQQTSTPSQALYEMLVAGKLAEAADLIDDVSRGRRLPDLLVTLLEPVLYRIGADLALDVIGPETEIAAVSFVRATVTRLSSRGPWKTQSGRRAMAVLPAGEQHDLGLQMVSSLLVRDGWCVTIGTKEELFGLPEGSFPELVLLSVTNTEALPAAAALIEQVHARSWDTKVMVGGLAFRLVPERAIRVKADLFAEDARAALATVQATFCRLT